MGLEQFSLRDKAALVIGASSPVGWPNRRKSVGRLSILPPMQRNF